MRTSERHSKGHQRGSALLMVLWLSAALTVIVFTIANTVRGETDRTSTSVDGTRAYYLAAGSIDRAILYIEWGRQYRNPDGTNLYWEQGMPPMHFSYPAGVTDVEVLPESGKLNINSAPVEDLVRLLVALGAGPDQAQTVATGIVDWRTQSAEGPTGYDQFYTSQTPSFRARHASFEEIEELLWVRGVTPDLFYGRFERDSQGRLRARGALRDCLSVYSTPAPIVDVNTADAAVLRTIGLGAPQIQLVLDRRRQKPIRNDTELMALRAAVGPGGDKLRLGGNSIYTLRATARLRDTHGQLSDLRRSVAAVVKIFPPGTQPTYQVLRWYDEAWKSEDNARP